MSNVYISIKFSETEVGLSGIYSLHIYRQNLICFYNLDIRILIKYVIEVSCHNITGY